MGYWASNAPSSAQSNLLYTWRWTSVKARVIKIMGITSHFLLLALTDTQSHSPLCLMIERLCKNNKSMNNKFLSIIQRYREPKRSWSWRKNILQIFCKDCFPRLESYWWLVCDATLKVVGSNPSTRNRFFLMKFRSAYVVYPVDFDDLRSLPWLRFSRVTNAMDSKTWWK